MVGICARTFTGSWRKDLAVSPKSDTHNLDTSERLCNVQNSAKLSLVRIPTRKTSVTRKINFLET